MLHQSLPSQHVSIQNRADYLCTKARGKASCQPASSAPALVQRTLELAGQTMACLGSLQSNKDAWESQTSAQLHHLSATPFQRVLPSCTVSAQALVGDPVL